MQYVSILIHSSLAPTRKCADKLLRYALRCGGKSPWVKTEIDTIAGKRETLLIARPLPLLSVRIAPYALPFLQEYFTE